MAESHGERLIRAAAGGDFAAAGGLLAPDVEFQALTPAKLFTANGAADMLQILEDWFAPAEAVEALDSGSVVDRPWVRYRIRWASEGEGAFVFEQQAYYDLADDRISRFQLVCTGDRALERERI